MIIVDQNEINVEKSDEKWNYYKLEDGTTLKVKIVLIKVIEEGKDPLTNPIFGLQSSNVIGVTSPADLIGNKPIDKIEDVRFTPLNDEWNEYKLNNGLTLMLKPALSLVSRIGERDPKGIPIYIIQAQPLVKIKK